MIERVADIAGAAVRHVAALAGRSGAPEQATAAATFTLESVLEGISYFRLAEAAFAAVRSAWFGIYRVFTGCQGR